VKRLPELRSELDQPVPFLLGHRDAIGQFGTEHLVLELQVSDLRGQFFLGGTGDQKQQGVVQIFHRGKISKPTVSRTLATLDYLPTAKAVAAGGYGAEIASNLVGPKGGQTLVDRTVAQINSLFQ
jgi:hypothetical protein